MKNERKKGRTDKTRKGARNGSKGGKATKTKEGNKGRKEGTYAPPPSPPSVRKRS